jgi:hypothetical protein
VRELIVATNSTLEGEVTAHCLGELAAQSQSAYFAVALRPQLLRLSRLTGRAVRVAIVAHHPRILVVPAVMLAVVIPLGGHWTLNGVLAIDHAAAEHEAARHHQQAAHHAKQSGTTHRATPALLTVAG